MTVFKRNRSKEDLLKDKYYNSFYKTGFVNDRIIKTKDRDFWVYFKDMLSDPNASSIFESVLVGYQEVPYKESIVQKALLRYYKDDILHRSGDQVFASTSLTNVRIFRCLFAYSPINFVSPSKGVQIRNTVEKIKNTYSREFTIIPEVLRFFEEQAKIHSYDVNDITNQDTDLFLKGIVTLLVPILEDGTHYNINGMLRYPYISERYHYSKSQLGQIKLAFRAKYGRTYSKYTAYFDSGYYTDKDGNQTEIFYIKFFNNYVNPFFAFDKPEIEDLMRELIAYGLEERTLRILQNTYDMYMQNIDAVRDKSANVVPYINIFKQDDSYYLRRDKLVDELNDMLTSDSSSDDDEDVSEIDTDIDLVKELSEEEMETIEKEQKKAEEKLKKTEKRFRVSRQAISIPTIKSLILGFNGKLFYGLYSHLGDNLLKITDINNSGFNGRESNGMISSKQAPKPLQIIMTISSNADLFMTNTDTHPFDVFQMFAYRKYFHERDTNPNRKDKGGKGTIPFEERFLKLDDGYGLIDSNCTKSETSAGICGWVTTLDLYRKYFEYKTPEHEEEGL